MEPLRDLHHLADEVINNFKKNFNADDCKLPEEFKAKVKSLKSFKVVYNDYSAIIKGDGTRSFDSYVPNQCFYMASYFIEYSNELSNYKQKIIPWITKAGIPTSKLTAFFTEERDNGKSNIAKGKDEFVKLLDSIGYKEKDRDYLIKFVTDYEWWYGNKTIDRSDFHNSPVLTIMGLSASSNAAMALIVDYLTQNPSANSLLTKKVKNNTIQKIYYGTPGSGKSHKVKDFIESIYPTEAERDQYVFRATFHPDSDYASFVGCYKPTMKGNDIKYEFVPQTFTKAYTKAWKEPDKKVFLIIEEINRGNCAQIFGDLFQLLDRKNGESEYPIDADADLKQHLEKKTVLGRNKNGIINGKLKLPNNLNILATMNTSDQSLFPMDSAFKRRWTWECVPIQYDDPKSSLFEIVIDSTHKYNWCEFLKAVNDKIFLVTDSEDKKIGNYFINGNVDEKQFIDKVMFYLWNDICKDEYHSQNYFLQKETSGTPVTTEKFTFNMLFEGNSADILIGFMEYLKVNKI